MRIFRIIIILFFTFNLIQAGYAQEGKLVILNLKKGYPVKGKIVEQTTSSVKIESLDGEIFEYKTDEINSIAEAKASSSSKSIFSEIKAIPQIYKKGDKILSFGIGSTADWVGAIAASASSSFGSSYTQKTSIPLIPVSFEYIVKDDIMDNKFALGIGGMSECFGWREDIKMGNYSDETKITALLISVRGSAHYTVINKLDTYAGISLGYLYCHGTEEGGTPGNMYSSEVKFNTHTPFFYFIGGRYFFNRKLAGMVELGSGISWLTFGAAIRI